MAVKKKAESTKKKTYVKNTNEKSVAAKNIQKTPSKKPVSTKKVEARSVPNNAEENSKKSSIFVTIGISFVVLVVIVIVGMVLMGSADEISNIDTQEDSFQEQNIPQEPIETPPVEIEEEVVDPIFNFLEEDFISQVNSKRLSFGHDALILSEGLSSLNDDYLQTLIERGDGTALRVVGDVLTRFANAGEIPVDAKENFYRLNFEAENANMILDNINNFHLYDPEHSLMAISIKINNGQTLVLLTLSKPELEE